jgi:small subunit ribosomal protein S3Ae
MVYQRKTDKWKMKRWIVIYAPKVFNSEAIGEMPAKDDKSALDRRITVSLDAITHEPSNAYTNLLFKVTEVNEGAAQTKLVRIEQVYSYIRSIVRRYHSVSDSVIPLVTSDGTNMVLKLIIVTKSRATHAKIKGIREEANSFASEFFKANNADAVIRAIIEGKFQSEIAGHVRHIADLSKAEVKRLDIK